MEIAQHLTTAYQWTDLILPPSGLQSLTEINDCAKQQQVCHALFHGPAGTGKTLAATLIGKELGKEVVSIDLSMVVSKYIGETEKNLEQLFIQAENKDWILFFDEADALFGSRTNIKDAHDKYANLETSYLLQRIENYKGLAIVATKKKSNIDDAFIRRLRYVIHFPIPGPSERLQLWTQELYKNDVDTSNIDLTGIANKFELSGATIMNVAQLLNHENTGKNSSIHTDLIIRKIETAEAPIID